MTAGLTTALALLLAAARPVAAAPPPAPPVVHSLFVGINDYPQRQAPAGGAAAGRLAEGADPGPLHGPVNDVLLMRQVLHQRFALDVGVAPSGRPDDCRSTTGTSVTLLNSCATRRAMLEQLTGLLDRAQPGELVLFFFAGHGSYRRDSGSSTILPWDAATPTGGHIYDLELRDLLWAAQRRGVSVVTIFDSCSSGTATRDLREDAVGRSAPPPAAGPPPQAGKVLPPGPGGSAYLVHLAAVADDGVAVEQNFTADDGLADAPQVNGLFTRALAQAITRLPPRASYRTIASQAGWFMYGLGATAPPAATSDPDRIAGLAQLVADRPKGRLAQQQAQFEGRLDQPFLGQARDGPPVFRAALAGRQIVLPEAGRFAGVTAGSTFSLHCTRTDAEGNGATLGSATVTTTTAGQATLVPDRRPGRCPDAGLWARESRHSQAGVVLRLGLKGADPDESRMVAAILAGARLRTADAGLITPDDRSGGFYLTWDTDDRCRPDLGPRTVALRRGSGDEVLCVGPADAGDLRPRLERTIRALANVFALGDLATGDADRVAGIYFTRTDCDEDDCEWAAGGNHAVCTDTQLTLRVSARAPTHVNALMIDGRTLAVQPLPGRDGVIDAKLDSNATRELFRGRFGAPGELAVLLLFSPDPVDVSALRQEPVRAAGPRAANRLEQLLMLAGQGRRDAPQGVPEWSAQLTRFHIKPAPSKGEPCP